MHRAIAAWLTERPWHAAVAMAFCGALSLQMMLPFLVLAGAIPVLVALRFQSTVGVAMAATGAAAAAWILYSSGTSMPWFFAGIVLMFFSPVLLALLLKRTGSMNLCLQVAVLGAGAVLIAIHLALTDPAAVWVEPLRSLLRSMATAGFKLEGDQNAILHAWARTMWGALAALALAMVFAGLLLGRWWDSLLRTPGDFGREYQRLRLGTVLGVTITAVFVGALTADSPLVASLAWVSFAALTFQGLAAAHRSKAVGRLNRGWLVAIYVLLVVQLSAPIMVFVLAIWGFADNWLRPRTQAGL